MSTICNPTTEPAECCPRADISNTTNIQEDISPATTVALSLLALATFVYGTFELYPVGLINDIAASLHVNTGKIGLLITGYAIVAGIITISLKALTFTTFVLSVIVLLGTIMLRKIYQ